MEKYKWTTRTFESIQWDWHHAALKQFKHNTRYKVVKLIHNWEPVGVKSHQIDNKTSMLCPICKTQNETISHMLTCTLEHDNSALMELTKTLSKINTAPNIIGILKECIRQPVHGPKLLTSVENRNEINLALKIQKKIGVQQLIYGRVTPKWEEVNTMLQKNCLHLNPTNNANSWGRRCVHEMLQYAYDTWCIRNKYIHEDKTTSSKIIYEKISPIYNDANISLQKEWRYLLKESCQEICNWNSDDRNAWYSTVQQVLKAKKQQCDCHNITEYFNPIPRMATDGTTTTSINTCET